MASSTTTTAANNIETPDGPAFQSSAMAALEAMNRNAEIERIDALKQARGAGDWA